MLEAFDINARRFTLKSPREGIALCHTKWDTMGREPVVEAKTVSVARFLGYSARRIARVPTHQQYSDGPAWSPFQSESAAIGAQRRDAYTGCVHSCGQSQRCSDCGAIGRDSAPKCA